MRDDDVHFVAAVHHDVGKGSGKQHGRCSSRQDGREWDGGDAADGVAHGGCSLFVGLGLVWFGLVGLGWVGLGLFTCVCVCVYACVGRRELRCFVAFWVPFYGNVRACPPASLRTSVPASLLWYRLLLFLFRFIASALGRFFV